ncbi:MULTISPECIES: DUF3891 family protein [unclassified Thermoactinomyces]|uniref:DUF3891 family protein n=1 Tax=unclassified Thermoactinomyces TaxID=2634588 RepID=UPI0018DC9B8E|nr:MULTISPECIES: DUF3891 family protein [unclassified Thermoactinomyces]MBH8598999.1 DUF3891 family protein [Thermoactinomyces sp. CICC 10523]MBH8604985.1 DUF3891 family protein [Thermoactinomyces sp. CICC 10522]
MIVRKKENGFVLIKQHDHSLVSGEFAAHVKQEIEPRETTLYAISHHDIGWRELDQSVLWNDDADAPYSFDQYPMLPKVKAYSEGISKVESFSPYAGFLCSKHFASFFQDAKDPVGQQFRQQELTRQHRLRKGFTGTEERNSDANFRLLQFCDDLSLFLCLNDPGTNEHPWYRNGIRYGGTTYQWVWEGEEQLRLAPQFFSSSFDIELPYQVVDKNRDIIGRGTYRFRISV